MSFLDTKSADTATQRSINEKNEELKKKGYLVVRGKTSRAYFEHKTMVNV